ncbi:MAG: hypothetical protein H6633_35970 [Anaerolineales bacterium]|nr:hypothetical protein [Anaerolineales bacterium]
MLTNKFDNSVKLNLIYPDRDKPPDIANTVQDVITYEQSLPPEAQLPHTPILIDLMQQWDETDQMRSDGESQRAVAAERVHQLDREIVALVRHARKTLDATYPESPSQAKAWGFEAKQSTKNILLPQTRDEHLRVLRKYILKEQSRPEAERFARPNLADAIRVHDELRAQLTLRQAGQNQREKAVAAGYEIAAKMYNYLQSAATHLLTFNFDFVVTVELQNWGFNVTTRRSTSSEEKAEEPLVDAPAETTTPEPAPETITPEATPTNGTSTNGSTNGSLDLVPDETLNGWE